MGMGLPCKSSKTWVRLRHTLGQTQLFVGVTVISLGWTWEITILAASMFTKLDKPISRARLYTLTRRDITRGALVMMSTMWTAISVTANAVMTIGSTQRSATRE